MLPRRIFDRMVFIPFYSCVEWDGSKDRGGYPRACFCGANWKVSRIVWTCMRGKIPKGMHVLHSCDNPACVNINHLFLGTNLDNVWDKVHKNRHPGHRKTHCPYGHLYAGENLWVSKKGGRTCLICAKQRSRQSVLTRKKSLINLDKGPLA